LDENALETLSVPVNEKGKCLELAFGESSGPDKNTEISSLRLTREVTTLGNIVGTALKTACEIPGKDPMKGGLRKEHRPFIRFFDSKLPVIRRALLQSGEVFIDSFLKSLKGLKPDDSLLRHVFIKLLFKEKLPEYQWPFAVHSLSQQQIENIFLWPVLKGLAERPELTESNAWFGLLHTFPSSTLLEETILSLAALRLEGSWGPPCDITAFPGRNRAYFRVILDRLLPLIPSEGPPVKIHLAGDSFAVTVPELLGLATRQGHSNLQITSTDSFEREIFFLRQGESTALFDQEGKLLLLNSEGEIFSKANPPPRKEFKKFKKLFSQFELNFTGDFSYLAGSSLQRVRLIHPQAEKISKENSNAVRFATADILRPESIRRAVPDKTDLVLLLNVINQSRFDRSETLKALQSLGTTLREGGILATGFAGQWGLAGDSKSASTLNVFQRKGEELVRLRLEGELFQVDRPTHFEQIPLEDRKSFWARWGGGWLKAITGLGMGLSYFLHADHADAAVEGSRLFPPQFSSSLGLALLTAGSSVWRSAKKGAGDSSPNPIFLPSGCFTENGPKRMESPWIYLAGTSIQ
jgi:hypothetical protein